MDFLTNAFGLYTTSLPFFLNPTTWGFLLLGALIGVIFGALPGLTSTMALALFTPLTFGLDPKLAIVFLIGIYNSSVYGGSLSAICINVPGTPSAIMTGLDGYPLAKRGEAGRAIGLATMSSCLGGLFGMLVLVLVAPPLAKLALKLHSAEYTLIALMGIALIAYISGRSIVRGVIAGFIGLLLATIGQDPIGAYPRFTMENPDLVGGLELVPALVGIFGVAEVLIQIDQGVAGIPIRQKLSGIFFSFAEVMKFPGVLLRSSAIGTFVGITPGAGGSIAAMTSYAIQKRVSPNPERLGTGTPEGIVAPESANNASVGGALVPMLTLGVPGDPMTAVLIGALLFHGLAPGPMLFTQHPDFVSSVFLSLTVTCFLILGFGILASRILGRLLAVPKYILMPTILMLCMVGSYSIRQAPFDVGVATFCGILGYFLIKMGIPVAPIALGLILGPLLEDNFRRTLMVSEGSLAPFVTRPGSLALILIIFLVLFGPFIQNQIRRARRRK